MGDINKIVFEAAKVRNLNAVIDNYNNTVPLAKNNNIPSIKNLRTPKPIVGNMLKVAQNVFKPIPKPISVANEVGERNLRTVKPPVGNMLVDKMLGSQSASSSSPTTPSVAKPTSTPTTVQKGQTLSGIAKQQGYDMKHFWNRYNSLDAAGKKQANNIGIGIDANKRLDSLGFTKQKPSQSVVM